MADINKIDSTLEDDAGSGNMTLDGMSVPDALQRIVTIRASFEKNFGHRPVAQ